MKGGSFLGSAVALLSWFFIVRAGKSALSDALFARIAPYCLTPAAAIGGAAVALGAFVPVPVSVFLWFLSGCGAAFILVRTSHLLYWEGQENSLLVITFSLFISCLVVVFVSELPSQSIFACMFMAALPIASFAFVPVTKKIPSAMRFPYDENQRVLHGEDVCATTDIEGHARLERGSESHRAYFISTVQMFFYSVAFSFALVVGLHSEIYGGEGVPSTFIWLGVFLSGILVMFYGMRWHHLIDISLMQMVLLVITAFGLGPFILGSAVGEAAYAVGCMLLMLGFTSFDFLALTQQLSVIRAKSVPFNYYFALGRFSNAFGMFVGWGLAAVSCVITLETNHPLIMRVLPLGLMILLVVLIAICYTWSQDGNSSRKEYEDDPSDRNEASTGIGAWQQSSEALCEEFNLSARERDVFALYAKGRDATFISNELFISIHTVKSHIYHIYRKMDVHSQQEVISMVEQRILDQQASEA